jgi:hypothetical protein
MKLVVSSDTHLNCHYARMSPAQLEERRRRIRAAFIATVEYAIAHEAAAYLHAGDFFDMPDPRVAEIIEVTAQLGRLKAAGIPAIAIAGGHDVPRVANIGASPLRVFQEAGLLHVFGTSREVTPLCLEDGDARVFVGGISYNPRLGPDDDPLAGVTMPHDAGLGLLMLHYGVEGHIHPSANEPIITDESLRSVPGVALFVIGHMHPHALYHVGGRTVLIVGSTERFDFGERGISPGFWELDVRAGDVDARHITIPAQPLDQVTITAAQLPPDDPTGALVSRVISASNPDQMLRLVVDGTVDRDIYHAIRWLEVYSEGAARNFHFQLDTHGLDVRGERAMETNGGPISVAEEIRQAAQRMMDSAGDEAEVLLLAEARDLLLDKYGNT